MKQVIYKYLLQIQSGPQEIMLPRGSVFRKVAIQGDELFIWCQHGMNKDLVVTTFYTIMTGESFENTTEDTTLEKSPAYMCYMTKKYLNTVFVGPLVVHVFANIPAENPFLIKYGEPQ